MASTRPRPPKLQNLFISLRRQAADTGLDQAHELFHGARLAVRVHEDVITLTISRQAQLVGEVELSTFRQHCKVPQTAQRWPVEGQNEHIDTFGRSWHYVAWRWCTDDEGVGAAPQEPR